MVIKDIERDDVEFYTKILGCRPVASVDHFVPEALGTADLVEEIRTSGDDKVVKVNIFLLSSYNAFYNNFSTQKLMHTFKSLTLNNKFASYVPIFNITKYSSYSDAEKHLLID